MPKVVPSQIVSAIDGMFGASRSEVDAGAVTYVYRAEVHALLGLLDQVPSELVDLATMDYLEYSRCRAVLATSLALWNVGDTRPARDVGGKDAVERIRRLMMRCHDELPPPEPELPFIADIDVRFGIEDRIRAAWTDFKAREWMGATVFAGAALEALLLWALKQVTLTNTSKRPLDQLHLADLISLATSNGVIDAATEQQASLAKDARNLVHPGRALRSGEACNKATALAALAAVYRLIDQLRKLVVSP
ncbi:hypothetical protein [Bradyrhizobium japonicum]|uniref:hypothetical protein n=2 Tax=Bradyrhizobium TaxID=374 RepID=UPI001E5E567A|nr:hypothetical protein [Bradyrhizobium japonicum]MCD9824036.1 hypothetical protein [Bradyrhizobium japonicum]MCD9896590.1 hypothetical protein [Bradyrhizobium japonicum]MEB2671085.1 hypothetical protein [Bradyrhizobium japonicum]WLB28676.1 hypothetical protein QIH85_44100 [Bradyrhizobium japonicum]WRI90408.1 hypothetical protein R3F75_05460 [Bradyrhizobium japonicum]